jgi:ribonuclease HII
MPSIIGIDEAGYGPNLGPFVMTAVAASSEDLSGADLWHVLRAAVRREGEPKDQRLLVADSKVVHANGNLHGLEVGVRSLLGPFPVEETLPLAHLLHGYCPDALRHLEGEAWYAGDTVLPLEVESTILLQSAASCVGACSNGRLELHVRSVIVCTPRFNDLLDTHGSKGAVLGEALVELLAWKPVAGDAHYFIDKHGGRNHYAALLQHAVGDGMVVVEEEGSQRSRYRLLGLDRDVRFTFQPRADGAYFCVALASMVSKYLREVLMHEFNRFWCGQVPGLKPTAGYPGDAARYWKAIRPAAERLGLGEREVWRRK